MPPLRLRDDDDSLWLTVADSHEHGFSVLARDRLSQLISQIPKPEQQAPRLFIFLGSKTRHSAIRTIWPSVSCSRQKKKLTGCHLALEASSVFSDRPLLLAEVDLLQNISYGVDANSDYSTDRVIVHYEASSSKQERRISRYGLVCARVVCTFAEVVCIFAQDFPDLECVVTEIAMWIKQGHAITFANDKIRPQLLLVTSMNLPLSAEAFAVRLATVSGKPIDSCFSQISVVSIHGENILSASARYRPVKEALLRSADEVRFARDRCRYNFSARHLTTLLDLAVHSLSSSLSESLDVVQASRNGSPVPALLKVGITDFLTATQGLNISCDKAIPLIATALLVDHYDPKMHCFHPRDVFMTLYHRICTEAISKVGSNHGQSLPLSESMALLERCFVASFEEWQAQPSTITTMDMHMRNIGRVPDYLANITSRSYCLLCLAKPPVTPRMSCGHRICHVCLQKVGTAAPKAPRTFTLIKCPLCQRDTTPTSLCCKPPTASPRVLSLDGGGNRVIVALEVLQLLAETVPVPGFVNRIADVVAGTSSGGLASLLLFQRGISVKHCQEILHLQAAHAFTPRDTLPIPFLAHIQTLIVSGCLDSLYSSDGIECALKQTYGTVGRLIDDSWASRHGIKLLLPATAVPGNVPYLFSNGSTTSTFVKDTKHYDSCSKPGIRRIPGYQAVSDLTGSDDIRLWQVARAISAAPPFFTPYYIQCLDQTMQDGALYENCPVYTAAREASPDNNAPLPAYILSLGTGSATKGPSSQRLWGRLADYLDTTLDSNVVWSNFVRDHPDLQQLGRLQRFDLGSDHQIRLDNVNEIPNMMQQVRLKYHNSREIAELRQLALVNMFYFELVGDARGSSYATLDARVLCRWQSGEEGFEEWRIYVQSLTPRVFVNGQFCGTVSVNMSGNLQCMVHIPIDVQTSTIRCRIQLGSDMPIEIGDSPFEISKLRKLQGIESPFTTTVL